jgi:membrane protease subunit HflC
LAAAVVVLIVGFYMCTFQVRFTEVAIVETFGEQAEEPIDEPGLYLKWPWPIQNVVKFDRRIRVLEDRTEETYTADSKNVIVTTSTFWTIEDPYKFHRSFPEVEDGEQQLRDAIRSQKKAVVGQYDFSNFVSTQEGERKLQRIEREMIGQLRPDESERDDSRAGSSLASVWRNEYGVDIKYFGITRLTLPQSVTKAIFESMKKTEENKANNYEAEGSAEAEQIVATATEARERIMSVAKRRADEIRVEGERIVSELYAQFEEHPDLRIFLDKIKTLQEAFTNNTTIIIDTEFAPIDLFEKLPGEREDVVPANLAAESDLKSSGQSRESVLKSEGGQR